MQGRPPTFGSPLAPAVTWRSGWQGRLLFYTALAVATVLLWEVASRLSNPIFLPGPRRVLQAFVQLLGSGELLRSVLVSYGRVLGGWAMGSAAGIPVGLLAGRSPLLRRIIEPYIQFFRFVPPIAFVSLALIWFGLGEASKVSLIFYTSVFLVVINTMIGVLSVEREKLRAAASLGAGQLQTLLYVVIPVAVPYIITGMRLAMGNSFMTVVAAEMLAAEAGIGHLIYHARMFVRTDQIFVGIIIIGCMGLLADLVFRRLVSRLLYRYQVKM